MDQNLHFITLPFLDQFCGIVIRPFGLVLCAEVAGEGLLTPGAGRRVGNGGEC